jgi:glycosyltransferase involved in cell wall biosynthesis
MGMSMIDVLMATYNGARHIEAQLASIAAQTHADWRLVVRDDGSTDATPAILAGFAEAHPGRVEIVEDGRANLGSQNNFSALMERTQAPYAALSDQDDIWIPERLDLSLRAMRELEARHGAEMPLLVFSDRTVLDDTGGEEMQWARNEGVPLSVGQDFRKLLTMNVVAGCTTLLNRPLLRLVAPVPRQARLHDHWLALVAAGAGRVAVVDRPTVRWRQHASNVTGIRQVGARNYAGRAKLLFANLERHRRRYGELYDQAQAFIDRCAGEPGAEAAIRDARAFCALRQRTALGRMVAAARGGLLPPGPERMAGFLLTGSGRA